MNIFRSYLVRLKWWIKLLIKKLRIIKYKSGAYQTIIWNGLSITEPNNSDYVYAILTNADGIERELNELKESFKHINNSMPTIFDVGANIGVCSLVFSQVKGAMVYSFEPGTMAFDSLKMNVKNNNIQNIIPINKGLSDKTSKMLLGPPSRKQHDRYLNNRFHIGLSSVHAEMKDFRSKKLAEEVEFTTLDDYCLDNKIRSVDYLKIDVEGHESSVIRGGIKIIKKYRPILQLEFQSFAFGIAKENPLKLIDFLYSLGYKLYVHTSELKLVEISRGWFKQKIFFYEILALPAETGK